jgi:hypothetical protein
MNYLLVLAALALIAPAAAQEALSFKGLPLGASEADVLRLYPKATCSGEPQRRACRVLRDNSAAERITDFNCLAEKEDADACTTLVPAQRLSVAGEAVEWIAFTLQEGRLGNILMQPQADAFANIARAYIDVYGPPLLDILTPLTTPGGAVLEDRALQWSFPGGSIALRRYSRDVKQSSVHYYSTEEFTRRTDEGEGARQRAAGDL